MRGYETVKVKPQVTETDWQGDPVGNAPAAYTIAGCQSWPRMSSEDSTRGEIIIEGLNLFVPPNKKRPIDATDVLELDGEDYEVEGVPGVFRKGGRVRGTLVALQRAGK